MSRYRGSHLRLNWTKPPSGSGQWEARLRHYVLMVSGGPTLALAKRAAEHAVARELGWERL